MVSEQSLQNITASSTPLLNQPPSDLPEDQLPVEETKSLLNHLTPWKVFYRTNFRALPLLFSFTFSGSLVLITLESMKMPSTSIEETNDNLTAGLYINTYFNLAVGLINGVIFSEAFEFNKLYGNYLRLKLLSDSPQRPLEIKAISRQVSSESTITTSSQVTLESSSTDLSQEETLELGTTDLSQEMIESWFRDSLQENPEVKTIASSQQALEIPTDVDYKNHKELRATKRKIESLVKNALVLPSMAQLISIPLVLTSEYTLRAIGIDPEAARQAKSFLQPIVLYLPCVQFRMVCEQIIVSMGRNPTFVAMILADIDFAIGAFIADGLCHGKYGLPEMGFAGLAWGLVIESFLTAVNFTILLKNIKPLQEFSFFQRPECNVIDAEQLDDLASQAIPTEGILFAETVSPMLIDIVIARLPKNEVSAYGISSFLFFLMGMFSTAFGLITGQDITNAMGKREYGNASQFARYGLVPSTAWVMFGSILLSANPSWILSIVEGELHPDVSTTVTIILPLTAVSLLAQNVSFNTLQVFRSRNEQLQPTKWFMGSLGLGVTSAFFIGILFKGGIISIAMADCILKSITAIGLRCWVKTSPASFAEVGTRQTDAQNSASWFNGFRRFAKRFSSRQEEPQEAPAP